MEALGGAQTVATGADIGFDVDPDYLDVVGRGISIDTTGRIITINRAGLYHVEWSINLGSGTLPVLIGLMEGGEPASALASSATVGSHSSGALILVAENETLTLSLRNLGGNIVLENPLVGNTAASIRVSRFADGPSV